MLQNIMKTNIRVYIYIYMLVNIVSLAVVQCGIGNILSIAVFYRLSEYRCLESNPLVIDC